MNLDLNKARLDLDLNQILPLGNSFVYMYYAHVLQSALEVYR